MKNGHLVLLTLFFSFLLTVPANSQLHWLQYRWAEHNWSHPVLGQANPVQADIAEQRPSDATFPEFKNEDVIFAKWHTPMVEDGFLWIAVARNYQNGPYDLLYVDAANDGNLAAHEPIRPYSSWEGGASFGPVRVMLGSDDGPTVYHITIQVYTHNPDRPIVQVMSSCWYEGQVNVNGQQYDVILVDARVNGTFNDSSVNVWETDAIKIGDGDWRRYGKYYQLGDEYYRINVARDGAYMEIWPAKDLTFGRIEYPAEIEELTVAGLNGMFSVRSDQGMAEFPEGAYRIYSWQLQKEVDSNVWTLTGQGFGENGDIELASDNVTVLDIGQVSCDLSVHERDDVYHFRQGFRGNHGEQVELGVNYSRPAAPKLHITNHDQTYSRSFTFEYG